MRLFAFICFLFFSSAFSNVSAAAVAALPYALSPAAIEAAAVADTSFAARVSAIVAQQAANASSYLFSQPAITTVPGGAAANTSSFLARFTGSFVLEGLSSSAASSGYVTTAAAANAASIAQTAVVGESLTLGAGTLGALGVILMLVPGGGTSNAGGADVVPLLVDAFTYAVVPFTDFKTSANQKFMILTTPLTADDTERRKNQTEASSGVGMIKPGAVLFTSYFSNSYLPAYYSKSAPASRASVADYYRVALDSYFNSYGPIKAAQLSSDKGNSCSYSITSPASVRFTTSNNFVVSGVIQFYDFMGRVIYVNSGTSFAATVALTGVMDPTAACPKGTTPDNSTLANPNANGDLVCLPNYFSDDVQSYYVTLGYTPDYETWNDGTVNPHPTKLKSGTFDDVATQSDNGIFYTNSNGSVSNSVDISYDQELGQVQIVRKIAGIEIARGVSAGVNTTQTDLQVVSLVNPQTSELVDVQMSYLTEDGLPLNPLVDSLNEPALKPLSAPLASQYSIPNPLPAPAPVTDPNAPPGTNPAGSGSGDNCGLPEIKDESGKVIQKGTSPCVVDWGKPLKSESEEEEQEPEPPSADDFKKAIFGEEFLKNLKGEIFDMDGECPTFELDLRGKSAFDSSALFRIDIHCQLFSKPITALGGSSPFDFIRALFSLLWVLTAVSRVLSA